MEELNRELGILKLQLGNYMAHPLIPTAVQHIDTFTANCGTKGFLQRCMDMMTEAQLDALKNSMNGNKDIIRFGTLAKQTFTQDLTNIAADELAMKTVKDTINKAVAVAFHAEYYDTCLDWKQYEKDIIDAMKRNAGRQGYNAAANTANAANPADNRGLGQ